MTRHGPLPFQQREKKGNAKFHQRSYSQIIFIVLGFLLCYASSVLAVGPHCNQVGHGPADIIMASGRINPKYTWYKRGHKTYVPVVMDPTYSHKEHGIIVGGLREISQKTCVEFDYYEDEYSLHGKDFVYITRQTKRGCWSYIGRIGRGKQEIGLPPGCITHRTAMHEMMHALGFRHEHVRHDRDDYIIIYWENIKRGRESNFQKRTNDLSVGPYDYDSIMHYDRRAFSSNTKDTIYPLKSGVKIGVRQKMSHWDAKKINIMYSCHAGGGGGGGGHLSWSPENDIFGHDLIDHSLLPAPRNASSSPPESSEIEVAYDELDYDPGLDPSSGSRRGHVYGPRQRSSSYGDEFLNFNHNNNHHPEHYRESGGGPRQRHGGNRDDHYDSDEHLHSRSPNNNFHSHHNYPQSYSNFDLDTYPTSHGDSSSDNNVDFYDI